MTISMHGLASRTFVNMLEMLSGLLDKGTDEMLDAQLAPDMCTLALQVRIACDHAKDAMANLSGRAVPNRDAPTLDGAGATVAEVKASIAKVVAYVKSVPAFPDGATRRIVIPIPSLQIEFHMTGEEYLRDWALPNFYFHIVTAYDILRHKGVQIGKRDFMPHTAPYIRAMA